MPQRKPGRPDIVTQYLHWALIEAHKLSDPEAVKVVIEVDLLRNQCTTQTFDTEEDYAKAKAAQAKR